MFGFEKSKCPVCGMKLTNQYYEWGDKKFCSLECKKSYRHEKSKRSCH